MPLYMSMFGSTLQCIAFSISAIFEMGKKFLFNNFKGYLICICTFMVFYYLLKIYFDPRIKIQNHENKIIVGDRIFVLNESNINDDVPEDVITVGDRKFVFNKATHVYEINGKPPIWIYWDNEILPMFGRITIESIKCVNPEFEVILVHDSTLSDYWPGVNYANYMKLTKIHRADVVHLFFIYTFGGIYFDIDTYSMHSFIEYYNLLTDYDLVGAVWYSEPIAFSHLGPARANLKIFKFATLIQQELIAKNEHLLHNSAYPFEYADLATLVVISRYFVKNEYVNYYAIDGPSTVGQLVGQSLSNGYVYTKLSKFNKHLYELNKAPILYFHGAARLGDETLHNLLPMTEDDTIFSYMAKCSLKQCFTVTAGHPKFDTAFDAYIMKFVRTHSIYKCFEFNQAVLPKLNKSLMLV